MRGNVAWHAVALFLAAAHPLFAYAALKNLVALELRNPRQAFSSSLWPGVYHYCPEQSRDADIARVTRDVMRRLGSEYDALRPALRHLGTKLCRHSFFTPVVMVYVMLTRTVNLMLDPLLRLEGFVAVLLPEKEIMLGLSVEEKDRLTSSVVDAINTIVESIRGTFLSSTAEAAPKPNVAALFARDVALLQVRLLYCGIFERQSLFGGNRSL